MLKDDFLADAVAGFNETPARGPYTLAMANLALFLSLPLITPNSILPTPAYRDDPTLIAGYEHQLLVLADLLENPEAPSLESPYATAGTSIPSFLLHPLSRGTVRLDPAKPLDQPIVDYRTASNPVDLDLHLAHVKYLRGVFDTPTVQQYKPVVTVPADDVTSDDDLIQFIKETMVFSYMHPCCTAAMLPREKGGVVGTDLRVHGAKGLRVADISVLPILPSSHTSAQAYAIGEKVNQETRFQ
ncbi:unnamed protein product [Parascedosporium putredinis]|uniref:Glucose-methanol-choline oxidoreductase C-terminal domain-containing protein n=1 Tax=Parascedosporium putredinis TaxID=1442378 RepID=A0A9P1H0W5_9PEZI|nr:unnamed protein product [Parascedosporium putredinis]CAI7993180.1 unnamed protein product [Parascedosporium putredinis]